MERGSLRALKVKNHQHGLNDDIINKPSIRMRTLFWKNLYNTSFNKLFPMKSFSLPVFLLDQASDVKTGLNMINLLEKTPVRENEQEAS